jgi:LuxR family maltose regulon positive regulatory protein
MSITESMWANTEKAFDHIQIAYNLSRDVRDIYLRIMILMMYSTLLGMLGDRESEKRMQELDDIMKQNEIPPFLVSMYITWRTHFLLEHNQIEEASHLFSEYGISSGKEKTHVYEMCNVAYTRLLLAQGKLDEAGELISELYAAVSEGHRVERMIELKIISADYHKKRGDHVNAIANLMDALQISSAENMISYFVYSYADINDLLEEAFIIQATTRTNIPTKFMDSIKLGMEKRNYVKKTDFDADLSNRELDTLKLIARDLSNQEIADKLFISLNTVKTHLKNIYLKLEVDNRAKAVAKARELGMV